MKKLVVGVTKAQMVDNKGALHICEKRDGVWIYQGRAVNSPLKLFQEVDSRA